MRFYVLHDISSPLWIAECANSGNLTDRGLEVTPYIKRSSAYGKLILRITGDPTG